MILRKIQLSNAGHRLLRTTARIEPADTPWLKIAPEFAGRSIVTVDSSEIAIEANLPESLTAPRTAAVVLEGNGGTVRVNVRVEPADAKAVEQVAASQAPRVSLGLSEKIARQPARTRLIAWPIAGLVVRLLIAASDRLWPSEAASPGLFGPVVLLGIVGAIVAVLLSMRGSEMRDLPPSALTGAILGAMLAAVLVAIGRTIEPPIAGLLGSHWVVAGLIWAALGAALAGISLVLWPPKIAKELKT